MSRDYQGLRTDQVFDRLISHVKGLPITYDTKRKFLLELEYLRTQALCDLDRRHPLHALRTRWQALAREAEKHKVMHTLKDANLILPAIEEFCGQEGRGPGVTFGPPARGSRLADLKVDQFFLELAEMVAKSGRLSGVELIAAYCGLRYLHLEAKRNRLERDRKVVLKVWKLVHPLIAKSCVLNSFRGEKELRDRVLFFLKDSF